MKNSRKQIKNRAWKRRGSLFITFAILPHEFSHYYIPYCRKIFCLGWMFCLWHQMVKINHDSHQTWSFFPKSEQAAAVQVMNETRVNHSSGFVRSLHASRSAMKIISMSICKWLWRRKIFLAFANLLNHKFMMKKKLWRDNETFPSIQARSSCQIDKSLSLLPS